MCRSPDQHQNAQNPRASYTSCQCFLAIEKCCPVAIGLPKSQTVYMVQARGSASTAHTLFLTLLYFWTQRSTMKGLPCYRRANLHCIICTVTTGISPFIMPVAPRDTGIDRQEVLHQKDFLMEKDDRWVIKQMHDIPLYICTGGKRISLLFPRVIFTADEQCAGQRAQLSQVLRHHPALCYTSNNCPQH